ncbi:MAG TPA: GntR family transcriptional regulator [Bacillota bacterium]
MESFEFAPSQSLYMQIKNRIKEQILSGQFKKGDKIPSERELCLLFGVSRITVRQAINEAINEGLLFTVQGKGTFVANYNDFKVDQELSHITPFKDSIASAGLSAGTKLLGYQMQPADFMLNKVLNIHLSQTVFNLNLLGTANDEPVVFYQSFFELNLGLKLYQKALEKVEKGTVFSTLDLYEDLHLTLAYADQTIEALVADESQAQALQIQTGAPLLLITSIIYSKPNLPVEYKKAFYRSDKYKFHTMRSL